jgi:hypothetical protein
MPRIRNKPQHEVIAVPGAADRVVIDRVGLADGGGYVATAPDLPGVRGTGGHERRLPAMSRGPYGYGLRQQRPLGNGYGHRLRDEGPVSHAAAMTARIASTPGETPGRSHPPAIGPHPIVAAPLPTARGQMVPHPNPRASDQPTICR